MKTTTIEGELFLTFAHLNANGAPDQGCDRGRRWADHGDQLPRWTGVLEGTSKNWLSFGPRGRANTGRPGLVFTDDPVAVESMGNVATQLSLSPGGSQVDAVALLSP